LSVDACSFTRLVFIIDQPDEFTNRLVGFQRVPQALIKIQFVRIPSPFFFDGYDTCCDKSGHNSLHSTFCDTNLNGDFPRRWLWCVREADKHVRVIAEEGPAFRFRFSTAHSACLAICIATTKT